MIWFACKKCKKTLGRPESSAGVMVFCDCGQSTMVPWESSTAPGELSAQQAPNVPRLEPLVFEPWRSTAPVDASSPPAAPPPLMPRRLEVALPPSMAPGGRPRESKKLDPTRCFNHDVPQQLACRDCKLNFCADCVCKFQGDVVCGPCKNYRTKVMQRTGSAGLFAVSCLLTAMVTAPLAFLLFSWIPNPAHRYYTALALLPQLAALVLGAVVLLRGHARQQILDWILSVSGIATAATVSIVFILLTWQAAKVL